MAVLEADNSEIVILRGNANGAYRNRAWLTSGWYAWNCDEWRLAHGNVRDSLVRGAVEMIRAEVNGIRRSWPQRQWSIKQNAVGAIDSIVAGVWRTAAKKVPLVFRGVCGVRDSSEADQTVRRIEIRVVHDHIGHIGAALVNPGEAAVAVVCSSPRGVGFHKLRTVVLSATDHEVGVGRMERKAFKLRGVESRRVEALPCRPGVPGDKDAAVVPGIDH